MPQDWVDYLNKFGLVGLTAVLFWAVHTGKLYLAREVEYLHTSYKTQIDALTARMQAAERELQSQRDLMNRIVNHSIGGGQT